MSEFGFDPTGEFVERTAVPEATKHLMAECIEDGVTLEQLCAEFGTEVVERVAQTDPDLFDVSSSEVYRNLTAEGGSKDAS